jgi:hypothetical protein
MSDKEHAKSKREEQKAFKVHEYAMLKCRIEAENLESGVIMLKRSNHKASSPLPHLGTSCYQEVAYR